MGFRARKSIKIAPGVKVNVGKKSIGVSIGGKHGGVSVNSKKGVNTRISVPGTGISYTEHVSSRSQKSNNSPTQKKKASPGALLAAGILLIITACCTIGAGIYMSDTISPTMLYVIGGFCGLLGLFYVISSRKK